MTGMPPVKRKFAYIGAGWTAGLILFLYMGLTAAVCMLAALSAACAVHILRSRTVTKQTIAAKYTALISVSALAGALFFAWYAASCYEPVRAMSGQQVTVTGTVTAMSELSGGRERITVSGMIDGRRAGAVIYTDGEFSCGEYVSGEFDAEIPENTLSFGAEDYYRSLGIYLTGSGSLHKTGGRNSFVYAAGQLREHTLRRIYECCPGGEGAFLASMLCSDKSRLPAETKLAVYRAGLGHLFAVSGTHIVMLAAFLAPLLKKLIVPVRLRSAVMCIILAAFAVFAGGSVSVVRACIMMCVSLSAVFFGRQGDSANSLGFSAFIITLADPFAVTSVSFGLSFTAAAAFGVLSPALTRGRTDNAALKLVTACLCVNVLSMPLCAAYLDEISLISAVSNIILIPLCTACLYMAFLFMLTGSVLTPVMLLAGKLAGVVIWLCRTASSSAYSYTDTGNAGLLLFWGLTASAVFIICALAKKRRPSDLAKCAAVYLMICVLAKV